MEKCNNRERKDFYRFTKVIIIPKNPNKTDVHGQIDPFGLYVDFFHVGKAAKVNI